MSQPDAVERGEPAEGRTIPAERAEPTDPAVRDEQAVAGRPAHSESSDTSETAGDSSDEQGSGEHDETVRDPAKLVRLGRMISELLGEVREAELDEQTLDRLRTHVERTAGEVGDSISPDLRDELTRLRTLWADSSGITQAELRVEQAQLAGWLEGVLQGIQSALSAEQSGSEGGQPDQSGGPQR